MNEKIKQVNLTNNPSEKTKQVNPTNSGEKKYSQEIFEKLSPDLKREIFEDIYKLVSIKKYPDIWIDFRICLYSKYILNNFYIINKNLTYYRQVKTSISSKFIYLGKKWWNRRMQAHNYLEYLLNKKTRMCVF